MSGSIALAALVLLCGLTVSGLSAAALEVLHRRPVRLAAPFVDPRRLLRSLVCVVLAGPMMTANEAILFRRPGAGTGAAVLGLCLAVLWLAALGVLVSAAACWLSPF